MTYNYCEIGERLKKARNETNYSLEKVAEACNVKQYQTISSWEKGNTTPSLDGLLKMCSLYDCELGYILGEEGYENKTRRITDIKQVTGLSENAVKSLCKLSPSERNLLDDLLSLKSDLAGLALAYEQLKNLIDLSVTIPSDDAEWFKKTQGDLNYIRFTLSNSFSLFAEKAVQRCSDG